MAITALRKTAELNEADEPKAAEAIIKNTDMDDICDSVDTVAEAESLTSSVDKVLATGEFKVKQWISNGSKDDKNCQQVTLGSDEEESEKVLGVVWSPKEDKFSYKVKVCDESVTECTTSN
jgi:hypothetical protein